MPPKETLSTQILLLKQEMISRKEIVELQFKMVNKKLDNIDDYLHNGLSKKIRETIKFTQSNPDNLKFDENGKRKHIIKRIWEHDQFWKMANRGMVMILFMIFVIVCALLGIDITSQKSVILKLLGVG